ncbi:MAG: cysteine--tRNA ligase [Actinomycetota bacterium]
MAIRIYNTMTRRKEDLVTREEGRVLMYVCGPTVYNYIHIGNARTFLNFDFIRRYMEFAGYDVTFAQNVTDIDDKIISRAREEGLEAEQLAEKYRVAFEEDMRALGVRSPTIAPRATEHVNEMLEVIGVLVEKGVAYVSEGDVYFEVAKFPSYGKLSGRALDEQMVTECVNPAERKRDPQDFALWKAAKPGEPSWESPWGPGRPGWHMECSTMSVQYLGMGFDIHGGGLDLVFPHHENERAQAEAWAGAGPFVRYWIHSGMLNIDAEKMSKSLGNIKTLREVLSDFDRDAVRMLMLGTHYRSPLSFSDTSLAEAASALERLENCRFNLRDAIARFDTEVGGEDERPTEAERGFRTMLERTEVEFRAHMDDDFNTAAAFGSVFEMIRETNSYLAVLTEASTAGEKAALRDALELLEGLCGSVGLFEEEEAGGEMARLADGLVGLLCELRQEARARKDFELADRIREGLAELGVRVEDVAGGYRWRLD